MEETLAPAMHHYRRWFDDPMLFMALRSSFSYEPGDDRATGYLFGSGQNWPPQLEGAGPVLLDLLQHHTGVRFEVVAFQAYKNGSGTDWHADTPFDEQAILSLGVTRTFGVRRIGEDPFWISVEHGDLIYMSSGYQDAWQHCVKVEDVPGERCSLVFRTVKR
jgi:alkylated DNA repair dioxygenase AlkB